MGFLLIFRPLVYVRQQNRELNLVRARSDRAPETGTGRDDSGKQARFMRFLSDTHRRKTMYVYLFLRLFVFEKRVSEGELGDFEQKERWQA